MTLATDLATRAQNVGQQLFSNLSNMYADGTFYRNRMGGFVGFDMTFAAGMVTLFKYATSDAIKAFYLQAIQEAVNRELRTNTTAAGVFVEGSMTSGPFSGVYGAGPTRESMGAVRNDLDSILGAASLGWILTQMPSGSITAPTRRAWLSVCKANCEYLDSIGDTQFYINGNFNARLLGTYWFTAANCTNAADKLRYETLYEKAFRFLVDPNGQAPTKGWAGYGWTQTVAPSEYDWSDGQGYFTENYPTNGGNGPGFDWIYSMTQLDALARLFTINRDTRLIMYINAISNKLFPRINTSTWILDGSGGSRQNGTMSMIQAWQPIQALIGAKNQNRTLLSDVNVLACWDSPEGFSTKLLEASTTGFSFWGAMVEMLAPVLHAAHIAQVKVAAS